MSFNKASFKSVKNEKTNPSTKKKGIRMTTKIFGRGNSFLNDFFIEYYLIKKAIKMYEKI